MLYFLNCFFGECFRLWYVHWLCRRLPSYGLFLHTVADSPYSKREDSCHPTKQIGNTRWSAFPKTAFKIQLMSKYLIFIYVLNSKHLLHSRVKEVPWKDGLGLTADNQCSKSLKFAKQSVCWQMKISTRSSWWGITASTHRQHRLSDYIVPACHLWHKLSSAPQTPTCRDWAKLGRTYHYVSNF